MSNKVKSFLRFLRLVIRELIFTNTVTSSQISRRNPTGSCPWDVSSGPELRVRVSVGTTLLLAQVPSSVRDPLRLRRDLWLTLNRLKETRAIDKNFGKCPHGLFVLYLSNINDFHNHYYRIYLFRIFNLT